MEEIVRLRQRRIVMSMMSSRLPWEPARPLASLYVELARALGQAPDSALDLSDETLCWRIALWGATGVAGGGGGGSGGGGGGRARLTDDVVVPLSAPPNSLARRVFNAELWCLDASAGGDVLLSVEIVRASGHALARGGALLAIAGSPPGAAGRDGGAWRGPGGGVLVGAALRVGAPVEVDIPLADAGSGAVRTSPPPQPATP